MEDFETLPQKQDSSNAGAEFRNGIEQLMRGHVNDCVCSSTCDQDEDDDESDQLVRRRRRSDLEGDDLAETSAARRRHSRILSRWAARQAQEMITTIERRNRENELMALAGLHTVSMLDSSFLRGSQSSGSGGQGADDRPSTPASALLQMWRELEDEHMLNRARERARQQRSITSRLSVNDSESRASESENEFGSWSQGRVGLQNQDGIDSSSREQSPEVGDGERERVRQIMRGWRVENGMDARSTTVSPRDSSPREEWLGETERERVRLVREWVQMASQQRDVHVVRRENEASNNNIQPPLTPNGLASDNEDAQPEHVRRDLRRLHGRQVLLDLLVRIEGERQRELQRLTEHRAVSDFAHRNRIQSLLRGRFLRNERSNDDERPPSAAARELGQLRQRQTVSGLREGFRFQLENIVRSQVSSQTETNVPRNYQPSAFEVPNEHHEQSEPRDQQNDNNQLSDDRIAAERNTIIENGNVLQQSDGGRHWGNVVSEDRRENWQQQTETSLMGWQDDDEINFERNWQENSSVGWPHRTPENDSNEEDLHLQEAHVWVRNDSHGDANNWHNESLNTARSWRSPARTVNRFNPPDDDSVYSMELRELLSRRSVSNLLRSGFRESLDQLIQSYVERQGQSSIDWELQRPLPSTISEQDQVQPRGIQNDDQNNPVTRVPSVLPSPPVPPPQPLWQHQVNPNNGWPSRHSLHRPEIEWEIINDLRTDMAKLQQGMSQMQRMLEACMDMQLELQRSVRQEVSAALSRPSEAQGIESSDDGSKWAPVRKGTCCVCCDNYIDSVLYRCGHVCTCSKCANELVRGDGKCPLCRAPILEVIRAYTIL